MQASNDLLFGLGSRLPALTIERDGSIFSHTTLVLQRKDDFQIHPLWQGPQFGSVLPDGSLPANLRDLFRLGMDVALVVIGNHLFPQDAIGLLDISDLVPLTEVGKATLEVIEPFLDFALSFWAVSIDDPDTQLFQGTAKLNPSLILTEPVGDVDPLVLHEAEDAVLVHIIGQRASILTGSRRDSSPRSHEPPPGAPRPSQRPPGGRPPPCESDHPGWR